MKTDYMMTIIPPSKCRTCRTCPHRPKKDKRFPEWRFCNLIALSMTDGRLEQCIRMAEYLERKFETVHPFGTMKTSMTTRSKL